MRGRRPKAETVDPRPIMPRGETEFEEKWIACDFQLVFKQVADLGLSSMKDTYEYTYRAGYVAGKSRRDLNEIKYPSFMKIL